MLASTTIKLRRVMIALPLALVSALFVHKAIGASETVPQIAEKPVHERVLSAVKPSPHGEIGSYLSARYARKIGDADAASYYFSHSLNHDPYDENLMKQAVRMHLLSGRVDEAAQISENLSTLYDGTQLSHLVLLADALKKNQPEKARQELKDISPYGLFSILRPSLEAWVVLEETGEAQEIAVSEHIRKLMIFEPLVAFQNALIFDLAGQPEKAREFYQQASQDPSSMSYRNLLATLHFYRRQGEVKEARELFDRFTENARISEIVGSANFDDVLEESKQAGRNAFISDVRQGVAEQLYALAGMLHGENVSAETQLYLRLALFLNPDMQDAKLILGSILEEQDKKRQAMALYEDIPKGTQVYRRAQIRKAFLLSAEDNASKAMTILESLSEDYKTSPDIFVSIGDIHRKKSRYDKAARSYSKALELVGDDREEAHWPILFARGISYERDGEWDKAEKDFRAALELYPDQPDVLNYLGYSWLMKGTNIEKARELLEQAVAERPEDAHIIDSMGWALYMLGEYDEALEYLEQAVNLMPNDPVVNDHLGDVLWRIGRRNEARFQWERALHFGPEEEERVKIEEKLNSGLKDKDVTSSPYKTAQD